MEHPWSRVAGTLFEKAQYKTQYSGNLTKERVMERMKNSGRERESCSFILVGSFFFSPITWKHVGHGFSIYYVTPDRSFLFLSRFFSCWGEGISAERIRYDTFHLDRIAQQTPLLRALISEKIVEWKIVVELCGVELIGRRRLRREETKKERERGGGIYNTAHATSRWWFPPPPPPTRLSTWWMKSALREWTGGGGSKQMAPYYAVHHSDRWAPCTRGPINDSPPFNLWLLVRIIIYCLFYCQSTFLASNGMLSTKVFFIWFVCIMELFFSYTAILTHSYYFKKILLSIYNRLTVKGSLKAAGF